MNEFLEIFSKLAVWIIAGLFSSLLTILIYFLKQNIFALKEVGNIVSEMRINFALQKKEIESAVEDLFKNEVKIESVRQEIEILKMDVGLIKNELNHNK